MGIAASPPVVRHTPPPWRRYWWWFAAAILLLIVVDLVTTFAAAGMYGVSAEANPFMRALLERGLAATVVVHVAVVLLATLGFGLVLHIGHSLDGVSKDRYRHCCEVWLALLITMGIMVAANNIAVIAVGVFPS